MHSALALVYEQQLKDELTESILLQSESPEFEAITEMVATNLLDDSLVTSEHISALLLDRMSMLDVELEAESILDDIEYDIQETAANLIDIRLGLLGTMPNLTMETAQDIIYAPVGSDISELLELAAVIPTALAAGVAKVGTATGVAAKADGVALKTAAAAKAGGAAKIAAVAAKGGVGAKIAAAAKIAALAAKAAAAKGVAVTALAATKGVAVTALAATSSIGAFALSIGLVGAVAGFGVIVAKRKLQMITAEKTLLAFGKKFHAGGVESAKTKADKEIATIKADKKMDKKSKSKAAIGAYGRFLADGGAAAVGVIKQETRKEDPGFKSQNLESLLKHRAQTPHLKSIKASLRGFTSARKIIVVVLSKGNSQAASYFVGQLNKAARI